MSNHEQFLLSPPYMETPWGLVRKPPHPPGNVTKHNDERDEDLRLNEEEMALLENSLSSSAGLDAVPSRLLRRYCRHFHLKWRRRNGRAELQDLVEWHLRNFKPNEAAEAAEEESTASSNNNNSLQTAERKKNQLELARTDAEAQETRAQQQTIDQYNSLLAVARVTENMSMVDDAAVSRVVVQQRAHERYIKKMTAQRLEKEKVEQRRRDLDRAASMMPSSDSSYVGNKNHDDDEAAPAPLPKSSRLSSSFAQPSSLLGLHPEEPAENRQQIRKGAEIDEFVTTTT